MTPTPDATPSRPSARPAEAPPRFSEKQLAQDIPYGVRIAAAWAWRIGLILLVAGALIWLLSKVSFLIIPLMVASLLAGLLHPVVAWLRKAMPQGLAVAITVLGFIGLIAGALALVGRQLATGFGELWQQALTGIQQVQSWLADGPLHITADQIDKYIEDGVNALQNNSSSILSGALSFGSTAGHFAAGLVLALFILIFFLLEGSRIWSFLVRLLPKRARAATDGAGRRGWASMVSYVRIQMFVAFVDAVGIGAGAAIIGVPLALPLGVLVFIASFIPVVGALVTGAIAVLLALVANGWVNALVMLGIVLLVQQLESHILQPIVMGKAVSLHPVAVILSVAAGSYLAGIPGALFAVPLLAVANTAVRYIAARTWEHDEGLSASYREVGAEMQDPDEDPNIKDTRPAALRPAHGGKQSPGGKDAPTHEAAARPGYGQAPAAETDKGE
ncbi:AI-2E family transporter [Arthrobacter cupressi]|uniref:Predicted PurR-regulated permease PerM n=1 Tax=Arthrobacter cupressi TaxID=1045773 RepID=A0A1G8IQP2_9MICC|nr:AI-2E family transporter [Arthrobacter cupressi]NYD79095.1 putative PurR-regulated permease PerM [Arthrobacter cupressi]SDI21234.1 Predicted PurR-regulated permease PerM [Arthrobacter cupressi]